jgi:hypothetical protein
VAAGWVRVRVRTEAFSLLAWFDGSPIDSPRAHPAQQNRCNDQAEHGQGAEDPDGL